MNPAPKPWYEAKDPTGTTDTGERGLRFTCTMCGNCCTGAPGYVLFTDEEAASMAADLGITPAQFLRDFTHEGPHGRSLNETHTEHGFDCVFLDRKSSPGKALCRVYRARPAQCRTWPFWPDNLTSKHHWNRAGRTCPGLNTGELHSPKAIQLRLDESIRAARRD